MDIYNFKWAARSEEGEWYMMYDHCVACSLNEAAAIVASKNCIEVWQLELDED